jgi:hypothetical protein
VSHSGPMTNSRRELVRCRIVAEAKLSHNFIPTVSAILGPDGKAAKFRLTGYEKSDRRQTVSQSKMRNCILKLAQVLRTAITRQAQLPIP